MVSKKEIGIVGTAPSDKVNVLPLNWSAISFCQKETKKDHKM